MKREISNMEYVAFIVVCLAAFTMAWAFQYVEVARADVQSCVEAGTDTPAGNTFHGPY
jgi:hypothetical protein